MERRRSKRAKTVFPAFFYLNKSIMKEKNLGSNMQERLDQIIGILRSTEDCEVVKTVLDDALEILYGGLRILPTKGEFLEQTTAAHEATSRAEQQLAQALKEYVAEGDCDEHKGRALDLALFIEQMHEVAQVVGEATAQCGEGDSFQEPPCDELQPVLNEKNGHEFEIGTNNNLIRRTYSVKLRGPRIAPWTPNIEEDVVVTDPIPPRHCVVVFKEFRGLMVRLHLERIIIVTDPWIATFGVPRGTRIPIWRLEWIFAEYVKTWNICNVGKRGKVQTTVSQHVKQDYPLNWFWRYYASSKC